MDIFQAINLAGGLGLFLLGMKYMGEGLELAAGAKLRSLLEKLTSNKFIALLVGIIVTGIIQSSSATDAMVVGFVNAGLMEFAQTIGILFGAKIGTTVTGLLLSFNIKEFVPILILAGAAVIMFSKKNNHRYYGQILTGFGMIFFGMSVMSESLSGLRDSPIFMDIITNFTNPVVGILAGMIFTAVIQSSSASIGILMAVAAAGAITLPQAVYVIYGFNIGTCVTAILSSIGANRPSKQVALCNVMITVLGALIMTPLAMFTPMVSLVESMFPGSVATQISATHIFFNISITILLLPFSSLLVKITKFILPDKQEEKEKMGTVYLDNRILTTPPMAVMQVEKECVRLAKLSKKSFDYSMRAFFERDAKYVEKVKETEKVIDYLTHCITQYIVKINGLDIDDYDRKVMGAMYNAIQDLERIGDHAENITEQAQILIQGKADLSDQATNELKSLRDLVQNLLEDSFYMFESHSKEPKLVDVILKTEDRIDDETDTFKSLHIERLNSGKCTAENGTLFLDMLTNLERVGDHATNVAFCIPYKNKEQELIAADAMA